jgi:hypothetical protein
MQLQLPDFYNESEKVCDGEASHFEQVHLNSGSNGIVLWPQLSHCKPAHCAGRHRTKFVPDTRITASDDRFSAVLH